MPSLHLQQVGLSMQIASKMRKPSFQLWERSWQVTVRKETLVSKKINTILTAEIEHNESARTDASLTKCLWHKNTHEKKKSYDRDIEKLNHDSMNQLSELTWTRRHEEGLMILFSKHSSFNFCVTVWLLSLQSTVEVSTYIMLFIWMRQITSLMVKSSDTSN